MPRLSRGDRYGLARDTNWTFGCVDEADVFPEEPPYRVVPAVPGFRTGIPAA
ncbi:MULTISPECIES: hypothetical protein [unclassified Frankia]|uniref:hypothetical protein n=1 Tax=unclassified Frankia TaxID=2632575 RepID=UPI0020249E5B